MASPYIGEIRMFGGNFAPVGWAFCDGTLLAIATNDALYALIGTTYGGDGIQTFALPDLRGRLPIHQGQGNGLSNRVLGKHAGEESVTLTSAQMPMHSHVPQGSSAAGSSKPPNDGVWATSQAVFQYTATAAHLAALAPMAQTALTSTGNSLPHENRPPFLALHFIIALEGTFPTQN